MFSRIFQPFEKIRNSFVYTIFKNDSSSGGPINSIICSSVFSILNSEREIFRELKMPSLESVKVPSKSKKMNSFITQIIPKNSKLNKVLSLYQKHPVNNLNTVLFLNLKSLFPYQELHKTAHLQRFHLQ